MTKRVIIFFMNKQILKSEYNWTRIQLKWKNGQINQCAWKLVCQDLKIRGTNDRKKQKICLNGIRDRDYNGIKDQCSNLWMSDTILKLWKKLINLGKAALTRSKTTSNCQINNIQSNSEKKEWVWRIKI